MKIQNPFRYFTYWEWLLWGSSIFGVTLSHLLSPKGDLLSLVASLIGVTALIFVAKGYVIGQVLTIVFALFYGAISIRFHYYGELITYLGMSAPMALMAAIAWFRHPYRETAEVAVGHMTRKKTFILFLFAAIVTFIFYFILRALGNANLMISTLSVTTSFLASALTFLRSPYYALAYAANDVVLIALWAFASIQEPSYLCMVVCFFMFLLNDLYGFIHWRHMQRCQKRDS